MSGHSENSLCTGSHSEETGQRAKKSLLGFCSIIVCDKCVASGPSRFLKLCFLFLEDQRTSSEICIKIK